MRKFFLWFGGLSVAALFSLMIAGWWLLNADAIDPPALAGERVDGTLEVNGLTRSWRAFIPARRVASPPLLLALHGSLSDGADMQAMSFYSFDVLAEREGFIAVYPDGVDRHWNDCRASASYTANTRDIDDVAFLRALIGELVSRYRADPSRVYVVGLSNGGHMAYRMGLEAADAVAGIAAYAASLPVTDNLDCEPRGQGLPVLIVNGTEDPVNPYEGGLVSVLGDTSRGTVLSSLASARYWATLAGHAGEGISRDWPDSMAADDTTVSVRQWGVGSRSPVALLTVHGGGHTMAHPVFRLPRLLGPTSHEFDTAEVTWRFFREGRVAPSPISPP